ncbi:S4 domain-containing protein, partial [Arsukibacterium sp.]|uniref:S4 domain-containing protein n=1 Tax=Arsukibacterium sp. TaxID=1977258 RepID=UPI00299D9FAD
MVFSPVTCPNNTLFLSTDKQTKLNIPSELKHRLAKWIAQSGHCSRRAAERLITAARVEVNGSVANHTDLVCQADHIRIDGVALVSAPPLSYLLYHKPLGIDCNNRPDNPASLHQL